MNFVKKIRNLLVSRFARNARIATLGAFAVLFSASAAYAITSLSVMSPNGGENYRGTRDITWSQVGGSNPDVVDIVLVDESLGNGVLIANDVAFDASPFSWNTTSHPDDNDYKVRVLDGNTGVPFDNSNANFRIDNTDPVTAYAILPAAPDGLNGWYVAAPAITLTCSDTGGSGCFKTWYRWDNTGAWIDNSITPVTALEGDHTLYFYSEDNATDQAGDRNVETVQTQQVKLDTVSPTITTITSTTANGSYNEPDAINVTLTFSEAVTSSDTVTVTLETGATDRTCIVPILSNTTTGSCTYTVQAGDTSADLTVNTVAATTGVVEDIAGRDSALALPGASNLANTSALVIDTTAPSAFTTGAVTTTGGTVVALYWNSTNTGVDVVVPVENDASLTGGTIQLQGNAGSGFVNAGSAYTILVGDLGLNKTISLTAAEFEAITGFAEGDVVILNAVITDLAGNSTTGTQSVTTLSVDQVSPVVDAGSDKNVKALVAQDATVTDAAPSSGGPTYQWTEQSGPGTILFSAPTAVDTNISVTDVSPAGDGTYVLRLTAIDTAGNQASDEITFIWDTVAPTTPVITLLDPINNANKTAVTITGTGEANTSIAWSIDDANVGTAAVVGVGTVSAGGAISITGIDVSTLDDGTLTASLTLTDTATNVSAAGVNNATKDVVAPTVSTITTKDANTNGTVDTATIVFSEAVKDSSFGTGTAFSIGGVAVTTFTTGAADDTTVDVSHTGVAGTDVKDVLYTPGTVTDLAGNPLAGVATGDIVEIDAAGPVLLSARTTSVTTATATFSEDLDGATVNGTGTEFTVAGTVVSAASETAPGVITLTYGALGTGAEPTVTYSQVDTLNDLAGAPNTAVTPVVVTAVDGVAPVLSSVHIQSNNASTTLAKSGDVVTLTFTSSETISAPTVTIQGIAATSVTNVGNDWTATRTMTGTDTEGNIAFSVTFEDDAAPTPNSGGTISAVTDASAVLYDRTTPSVNAGTDKEVNVATNQDATTSDAGSGIATWAWTGPGAIVFNPSNTEDSLISATTDGTYTLRLTVTDNAGNVAFDELTFIWDTTRPEPLTSSPSNGATGVSITGSTATVTFDEDIVLTDPSRILLVNDTTGTSLLGAASVSGGNGASAILNLTYSDLAFGTKYRINVKPNSLTDVAGNSLLSNLIAYFTAQIDTIPPVVSASSASGLTTTSAILNITTNETAVCRYAPTDSAFSSMTLFGTTTATTHEHVLTGLIPSTSYDYYVRCADTTAQTNAMTSSAHITFTTTTPDTTAPVISNIQSISITGTEATITWTTDEAATSRVEYGLTSAYGAQSAADATADNTSHSVTLTGLVSGSTYHFRVKSDDALANAGVSGDNTFATLVVPDTTAPAAPVFTTAAATTNADTYTLAGTVADDGGIRIVRLMNGATTTGSFTIPAGQTTWAIVSELYQETANAFTATATDEAGNVSTVSATLTITEATPAGDTTPPTAPAFTTTGSTLDADTITIAGTAGAELPTDGTRIVTILRNGTAVGSLSLAAGTTDWSFVAPLLQNTTNTFAVTSTDESGNTSSAVTALEIIEETAADTTAPVLSNIQATSITTTDATITWESDENATSLVEYGLTSTYGSTSAVDASADNTSHSVALSSLSAGTTYHYRVISSDTAGNISTSTDNTFTTVAAPDTTAPSVPVITTGAATVDVDTYTIAGTAGADLPSDGIRTITIFRGATVVGSVSLPAGTTAWSFIAPLTQNSANTFTAKSTDAVGNTSAASAPVVITEAEGAATLAVTAIDAVQTFGTADNTFGNGWSWKFHITVPTSETLLAMKFADLVSGANSIAAASNIRIYSAQSSNATASTSAITIAAANTYSDDLELTGDLDASTAGRQVEVTVEVRIPVSTAAGSYSTSYGVRSEEDAL